jgi:hypothetical protein
MTRVIVYHNIRTIARADEGVKSFFGVPYYPMAERPGLDKRADLTYVILTVQ